MDYTVGDRPDDPFPVLDELVRARDSLIHYAQGFETQLSEEHCHARLWMLEATVRGGVVKALSAAFRRWSTATVVDRLQARWAAAAAAAAVSQWARDPLGDANAPQPPARARVCDCAGARQRTRTRTQCTVCCGPGGGGRSRPAPTVETGGSCTGPSLRAAARGHGHF